MKSERAVAIKIGDRFFYGFGQGGRVLTAWSLAGAALFGEWGGADKLLSVEKKLLARGKVPRRVVVAPATVVIETVMEMVPPVVSVAMSAGMLPRRVVGDL